MDLMSVLTAVSHPGVELETPDDRDPAAAAAFASLLAGLLAPVTPPSAASEPGAASTSAATAPIVAGSSDPVAGGSTAPALRLAVPPPVTTEIEDATSNPPPVTDAPDPALGAPLDPDGRAVPPTSPVGAPVTAAGPAPIVVAEPFARPRAATPAPEPGATAATSTEPTVNPLAAPLATTGSTATPDEGGEPSDDPASAHAAPITPAPEHRAEVVPSIPLTPDVPLTSAPVERMLAAQLVQRIGRLRQGPDGEHELTIQLEPAELGRLELRVRLEAGVVHVHVAADGQGTSDLLRRSLPDLRELLAETGLAAGSLDVGAHRGRRDERTGGEASDGSRADRPTVIASRPAHRPFVDPARGVDVLL